MEEEKEKIEKKGNDRKKFEHEITKETLLVSLREK